MVKRTTFAVATYYSNDEKLYLGKTQSGNPIRSQVRGKNKNMGME